MIVTGTLLPDLVDERLQAHDPVEPRRQAPEHDLLVLDPARRR